MGMLLRRHQNLEVRPSTNDKNEGVTEKVTPSVEEVKIDDAKQKVVKKRK